jgi:hypothetical protein
VAIERAPAPSHRADPDREPDSGPLERLPAGRRRLIPLLAAAAALALAACSPTDRDATPEPAEAASAPAATAADDAATAVTAPTDVPTSPVPTDAAQSQLESQMGRDRPPLPFDDLGAACEDLTANGAEWAFIATTAPRAGQRVASGFHARGCANVFEAALSWRLVTGLDEPIAEGFGMASCGTGCVGTFDLIVEYPARDEPGIGYLEVFASSPEDGRPIHVNRIPLILE